MKLGIEPLIDFTLFTAIEIERRAVCKAFGLSAKHRVTRGNRVYWHGQLPLPGGCFYEIVVAQSPDMGNIDAAVLATSMIHDWNPGALLLVGIAGAGSADQKLGDLVLGRDVYYHERGKETHTGSKLEPYMYRADALLWNHVTALPPWKSRISVPRPDGENHRPQIHYGVIASGERVIADIAAREQIAASHRKIVAIEMEGHGVGAALWQSVDRVRGLVIRSICDLADASKNSQWHSYAATVSAGFAKHFLLDQPIEPRNSQRAAPTRRVKLTLAMEFSAFDAKAERLLIHALAGFLDIPPEAVKVCSVEEGSVKLVMELPADAAERLLEAGASGVISLENYLAPVREVKVSVGPNALEASAFASQQADTTPDSQGREIQEPFSGSVPLHNLPYPRLGDLFTGRQEELDALAGGGTAAITQSAAISGLGGIGKTRLAVEYAWRSGNRYTAAWFIRADSPENLRRNLAALAGPELLNLPEWEEQDENKTVAAVKRWLREHPGWLMILDNVDTLNAAGAVLEILPSLSRGRVLITSRLGSWPPDVWKQPLDKLSKEEAVRFLRHRTEGGSEPAADDSETAGDLVQRVDGLPLALEQAAAFIVRHRMRLADYLHAWEGERQRVLQWFDPLVMRYPASVAVTWQHTFQQLTPTAAALLRLTAFLAPDPLPVEIFEQGAEHVEVAARLLCEESGKAPDGKSIREAMADLAGFSMISQQDGGMLVVHRLVQEALHQQIRGDRRKNWIEGALRIVNGATKGDPQDVRTWPLFDRLRPHALEVVTWADQEEIAKPTSRLMSYLGVFLDSKGLYSQAEPWLRRALAINEASFGNDHPNVAMSLNGLSHLLQGTNRLEEAEPLIRRALAIAEASFGNDRPDIAKYLNNLALLLRDMNRLQEAEPLMRRALSIAEASFGNEHPSVAIHLNNLAQLLQATNRLREAEPLLRRALAIDEGFFGNDLQNGARDLNRHEPSGGGRTVDAKGG